MVQDTPDTRKTAGKSEAAFRTISEVAEELDVPQHVLRFWETKFSQIRPMKRGGGRRYYRPEDVALLRRIRGLLYEDGFTIKGVQKLLREGGAKAVIAAPAADVAMIGEAVHHAPSVPVDSRQTAMDLRPDLAPVLTRAMDDASAPSAAVDAFVHDDDPDADFLAEDDAAFALSASLASGSLASVSAASHPDLSSPSMRGSVPGAGRGSVPGAGPSVGPSAGDDTAEGDEPRAGGDLIAALEAKARHEGLDARTRAVVEDVLCELLAVRDLLNNAVQATAMK